MNNPFDLKNYKPKISMKDVASASKISYQQSVIVNNRRSKGFEPSIYYSHNGMETPPEKIAIAMPTMPKYDNNESQNRRRREARQRLNHEQNKE